MKHVKIKVSVIVPVYNVEDYLEECLKSIINQTLNEIEIICIEDCSTDNSLNILEEFAKKDSRIKIIKNQSNKGLAAVRNIGIKASKGEYLSFVDSDDYLDLRTYEKTYKKSKELNLDYLLFKSTTVNAKTGEFNPNDSYFSLYQFEDFEKDVFTHNDTKDFTCELCVQSGSKLIRREFLVKNNFYYFENHIFEDELFFYTVYLNAERISVILENLYYYRTNRQGSIIANRGNSFIDIVEIFRRIRAIFYESGNLDNEYKYFLYDRFFRHIFNRFNQVSKDLKEDFYQEIRKDFHIFLLNKEFFEDISLLNEDYKNKVLNVFISETYDDFSKNEKDKNKFLVSSTINFILNLDEELDLSKKELKNKIEIIDFNEEKINEQNRDIFILERNIDELNYIMNENKSNLKQLDSTISNLNEDLEIKTNLISDLKIKNNSLENENLKYKNSVDTLKNEINSLKQEKNNLKNLNQELLSSNSWKITEPIRKFRALFKRQ